MLRLAAAALVVAGGLVGRAAEVATAADDVTLTLTAQPYAVAVGAPWSASFDVAGDLGVPVTTASTAPPTTAGASSPTLPSTGPTRPVVQSRVQLHRPLDDRAELRGVLDGDRPPVVSRLTVPVALTGSTGDASFDVTVPTTNDADVPGALVMTRPGVYPVSVDLLVDGEVAATHLTFVERLPAVEEDTHPALRIAVVAGVDDPGPLASAADVAAARAATVDIAGAAAALDGVMSVRLPPTIVAGLGPADLADVRIGLADAELLATPALALDPSSAAGAGQDDAFANALRDGEDLLADALPNTRRPRSAWLTTEPISSPAATMLRSPLGFDLLVLDQARYDSLDGTIGGYHDQTLAYDVALDDGSSLPGLVVHGASRWLDPDQPAASGTGPLDRALAIMAELRVTRGELGPEARRTAVLAAPAGTAPDPALLAALAGYAAATPGTEMTRLAEIGATTDPMTLPGGEHEVVRLPPVAGIDLAERVDRINLTALAAGGAGSMLVDQDRAESWDTELDELLSTSLDEAAVDARLGAVNAEIAAVHACIQMPEPFTFTLTGRSSPLRLNLTNTCDEDLRVVVHPTSSKLSFPGGDVAKTLVANDVTEVSIDVRSRSNGTSAIGIELLTPVSSLRLPQTVVLTARVNALSGLGQVVTGGALLVLLSWWYGHFRRRRRQRRAMLGEVDNPVHVRAVSPDAAEATIAPPHDADPRAPGPAGATDSVTRP